MQDNDDKNNQKKRKELGRGKRVRGEYADQEEIVE